MFMRFYNIIFLFILSIQPIIAQNGPDITDSLNVLYQEFRYPEVIRIAENALSKDSTMAVSQKCDILRLLSLSYFAQQDMQGALKNFARILQLDPNYRLDPVKNSPKILAFFEEIRRQTVVADLPSEEPPAENALLPVPSINIDSLKQTAKKNTALSFLLPGSGQIKRDERIKGWILAGGNAALLGTFIYFNHQTNHFEKIYLQTTNPADIHASYEDYNQAYQKRNWALAGFLVIWLYTQIDFIFLSSAKPIPNQISWYPTIDPAGNSSLNLSFHF